MLSTESQYGCFLLESDETINSSIQMIGTKLVFGAKKGCWSTDSKFRSGFSWTGMCTNASKIKMHLFAFRCMIGEAATCNRLIFPVGTPGSHEHHNGARNSNNPLHDKDINVVTVIPSSINPEYIKHNNITFKFTITLMFICIYSKTRIFWYYFYWNTPKSVYYIVNFDIASKWNSETSMGSGEEWDKTSMWSGWELPS